jgi:hypothetical protein
MASLLMACSVSRKAKFTTTFAAVVLSSSAPKLLRHQIEDLLRGEFIDVQREAVADRELGEDA